MSSTRARQRLSIFLPSLAGGGAERALTTIANALGQRGVKVSLVVGTTDGPYRKEVGEEVRLVELNASRAIACALPLARHIRRERPDAVLSAMSYANIVALVARTLARVPCRVVISERAHVSSVQATSRSRRDRLLPTLMRLTYPWADGVIAVSAGVADDLARTIGLPRERIDVVYNPLPLEEVQAQAGEDNAESPKGRFILAVGRIEPQKDYATLLQAFSLLSGQDDLRLVILGEGALREELSQRARELGIAQRVSMPGFRSNPFSWMRQAELVVLSSAFEGLPNVLLQAMACGTPVVSTDCPSGPNEILEGGKWGRLVPVGDAAGLAQAIQQTLSDTKHPDVQARAKDFSVEAAVAGYSRVLGLERNGSTNG